MKDYVLGHVRNVTKTLHYNNRDKVSTPLIPTLLTFSLCTQISHLQKGRISRIHFLDEKVLVFWRLRFGRSNIALFSYTLNSIFVNYPLHFFPFYSTKVLFGFFHYNTSKFFYSFYLSSVFYYTRYSFHLSISLLSNHLSLLLGWFFYSPFTVFFLPSLDSDQPSQNSHCFWYLLYVSNPFGPQSRQDCLYFL